MMSIDLFSDMEEYEIWEQGFGQPTLFLIEKLSHLFFSQESEVLIFRRMLITDN